MSSDTTEPSKGPEEASAQSSAPDGTEPSADPASAEAALRAEAAENWNKYLRAVAEIENLRRRNAREVENARRYGAERLVAGLLPVRDSIEAGLKAAEEADPAGLDVSTLLDGERATLRLLDQALEAAGISEIDPHGEPFDPDRHEAMSMLPAPDAEPGTVIAVIQKGYELNTRIVRPARVVVAAAPAGETAPD